MRTKAVDLPKPYKLLFMSLLTLGVLALTGLGASLAHAQQVYRIVGPDGKVTFSDKPPPATVQATVGPVSTVSGGSPTTGLPFELRQIATRFPVTLYSGANCEPCTAARTMLTSRGIPFAEKTVNTNDDILALQRLSGETVLPFATIGSQQLKGYSDAEWTQYLNAAGYPATTLLPANYRPPATTPLVAVTTVPVPAAPQNGRTAPPAQRPSPDANPATANPAGIRF